MKQRNVVKNIITAAMLMLMALAVGCSSGGPSNAEIEKTVLAELNGDGSAEIMRSVINFSVAEKTKTDDSHYNVKASFDYQFNMSYSDFRTGLIAEARAGTNAEKLDALTMLANAKEMFGEFKKDDLFHKEVEMIFAKTDKGWKLTNAVNDQDNT